MANKEIVLELGVEGGGANIFRTRSRTGDWQFHVEGNAMDVDENDEEVWRSWCTEPVSNIEDALRAVADDGCWVLSWPTKIHTEYRSIICELVEAAVSKLPPESSQVANRQMAEWQWLCDQESESSQRQVIWRAWAEPPGADCCGHGIEFHDSEATDYCDILVAFIEGFDWWRRSSPLTVCYSKPDSLPELEFNEMKSRIEALIQKRRMPLGGNITERIKVSANC